MAMERPVLMFDRQRLAEDMAAKGWDIKDLARSADISNRTVYRFLNGEIQTIRTVKKLASALGYSVRRYLRQKAAA